MKIYKSIAVVVSTALGLLSTGCSDWLDYTPKDKQTYEQQFSNPIGFRTTVNGIYNNMTSTSLYGYNLSYGPIDIMGMCYSVPNANARNIEFKSATYTGTYASAAITSIWTQAYRTILNANLVLKALDEYPGVLVPDEERMTRAEMLALRAYLHLDLVRLFGPIYSVNPDGLSVPFADTPEVVKRERLGATDIITNKILPDLTEAQNILKDVDPILTDGVLNSDGGDEGNQGRYRQLRLNYYAVTLLKARAYMWMADYDNALTEALKIAGDAKAMQTFPWVDPVRLLANNSNPDRVFSTECIFGFYNSKLSDVFNNTFSGALDPAVVMQPRTGYTDLLFANTADYRRQSQWTGTISSTGTGLDFIKYKSFETSETNPDFWATFFGLLRISEAYYIASEAYMQKGDMPDACRYLNDVRTARGIEEISTDDPAALLKEIKLEYLREMRGEGQIFFMHKRFNQSLTSRYPEFNGAELVNYDTPALSVRYNVPIPSGETY